MTDTSAERARHAWKPMPFLLFPSFLITKARLRFSSVGHMLRRRDKNELFQKGAAYFDSFLPPWMIHRTTNFECRKLKRNDCEKGGRQKLNPSCHCQSNATPPPKTTRTNSTRTKVAAQKQSVEYCAEIKGAQPLLL